MKKVLTLVLLALMTLSLAACSGETASPSQPNGAVEPGQTTASSNPTSGGPYKIAFCLSGSINDSAWNALAYQELENLKAQGHETAYTENIKVATIEEVLRNYANEGYQLIVGHGFEFGEPAIRISSEYPNSYFFITGKKPTDDTEVPPNVCFVDQKYHEAAYLAGMLAGGTSETGKIGYIAGASNPTQIAGYHAFIEGAKYMNPDIEVAAVITGTFTDPAKGQETAIAQIEAGADVITQSASNTGMGAMEAAASRGVYIIGNGAAQEELFPDYVIGTFFADTQVILENCVTLMEEGKFGGVWRPGIAEDVCKLPYIKEDVVPAEVIEKIEQRKQEIIDGTFVVEEVLTIPS